MAKVAPAKKVGGAGKKGAPTSAKKSTTVNTKAAKPAAAKPRSAAVPASRSETKQAPSSGKGGKVVAPAKPPSASAAQFLSTIGRGKEAENNEVTLLRTLEIVPDEHQPRDTFRTADFGKVPQETIVELADNIAQNKLINPITVRVTSDGRYQIVAGERRWRAFRLLIERKEGKVQGLRPRGFDPHEIPAIVRNEVDLGELRLIQLAENLQREDLSDLQVAKFLGFVFKEQPDLQKKDIARMLNKSPQYVSRVMGMLDPRYRDLVESGIVVYASLLAQLKTLPAERQRQIVETARSENRSITVGDIRSGSDAESTGVEPKGNANKASGSAPVRDPLSNLETDDSEGAGDDGEEAVFEGARAGAAAAQGIKRTPIHDDGGDIPSVLMKSTPLVASDTFTVKLTLGQLDRLQRTGVTLKNDAPVELLLDYDVIKDAIERAGGEIPEGSARDVVVMRFYAALKALPA